MPAGGPGRSCWDPAQADGCRRIIATGHPGLVFVPIVIDRDNAPLLAGASPYLVLFNTVIGAVDLDTEEGRALVAAAITATGAQGARFRSLCDIILGIASDAAHEHLEELMGITYKSKFVDGWYQQGVTAGEARGISQGEARGEARGRRGHFPRPQVAWAEPQPCAARADRVVRRRRPARQWSTGRSPRRPCRWSSRTKKREAHVRSGKSKSLNSEFKILCRTVPGVASSAPFHRHRHQPWAAVEDAGELAWGGMPRSCAERVHVFVADVTVFRLWSYTT